MPIEQQKVHNANLGASIIGLVWSILAIIYSSHGLPNCATTFTGIEFDYAVWLKIFGYSGFGIYGYIAISSVITLYCCNDDNDRESWSPLIGTINALCQLFSLCWYIVGAIILFKTLHNNECKDEAMWKFGLAYFIFPFCVCGCLCCFGVSVAGVSRAKVESGGSSSFE